jgi:hypothetical protein
MGEPTVAGAPHSHVDAGAWLADSALKTTATRGCLIGSTIK